jgi:pimeloyl-ACP methyl ester carboxylesterase
VRRSRPWLFLPGWCVNRTVFTDLISRTSEHRRSLAIDWPGHGHSDAPPRDFGAAYEKEGSPLEALSRLVPAIPVLHLYAQPQTNDYLNAQQAFAAGHPWFRVRRLNAASHFTMFEVPDEMAAAIEHFAA